MNINARPFWFVGGEKGGVGKSFCAHLMIDYLREYFEGKLIVVETDAINPDVGRTFVKKNIEDVEMRPFKIKSVNDWIRLMELVESAPDDALLLNGAAQLYEILEMGQSIIKSIGDINRQWVTWWVMGPEIDSVMLLDRYVSMLGAGKQSPNHRLVVIENAGRSDERHFNDWRDSKLYERLVKDNCPIIGIPHLATDVGDKIRNRAWSIAEARTEFQFPYRIVLETWRNAGFSSITKALNFG